MLLGLSAAEMRTSKVFGGNSKKLNFDYNTLKKGEKNRKIKKTYINIFYYSNYPTRLFQCWKGNTTTTTSHEP
jgi:hypothetical protein